jgi:thiamine-phosphate pyrophosphorylase
VSLPGKLSRAPILCYVTDRKGLGSVDDGHGETLLKRIAAAAEAGIDWIQIREKDPLAKELSFLTRNAVAQTKQIAERSGRASRILVNDRLDVAKAEHAGGVHLGENSLPVRAVCNWLAGHGMDAEGGKFLVGVSCHSVQAATDAERAGADYIFFGPVFATPSKVAFGSPQGVRRLAEVCSAVSIPVLAIGGITLENASDCLAVGAGGIAAIRLFQDAQDLASLVGQLRAKLPLTKAEE